MTNQVTITKKEYDQLQDRDFKLECLENGGVDNWSYYGESLEEYHKAKEEDKKKADFIKNNLEIISESICDEIETPAGPGAGYGIRQNGLDSLEEILNDIYNELTLGIETAEKQKGKK